MRAVAPDRRPPVAAWGFALIAAIPLFVAWIGFRAGWPGPVRELGTFWAFGLLGVSAGMIAAAGGLRGRWVPAYLALVLAMLPIMPIWTTHLTAAQAMAAGHVLMLGLDLWMARVGLLPEWWPRLKLGLTVITAALLLAPELG